MAGTLYLVPTPIGNLEDMTFRAIQVLKSADLIIAEDTRTSGKLLKHFQIETPIKAYHSFNEHQSTPYWIGQLSQGVNIAMISDAGTPGISDPGYLLVHACHEAKINITCLPGATAFVPALVSSGLPTDKFYFEGFLPHKKGRQTRLLYVSNLPCTTILYESPNRLIKCLEELALHCGKDRKATVVREISKIYEEVKHDTLEGLIRYFMKDGLAKGEIVVILQGKTEQKLPKTNKYRHKSDRTEEE